MTEATNIPAEDAPPIHKPRDLPKRKMSMWQQAEFLRGLEARCKMHGPLDRDEWAGEATLALTRDDMAALCCVTDTLALFDFHDAGAYVKARVMRKEEGKRGGKR